jgi:hypothetical protein
MVGQIPPKGVAIPKIMPGLVQTSIVHSLALWECPPKSKGEAIPK